MAKSLIFWLVLFTSVLISGCSTHNAGRFNLQSLNSGDIKSYSDGLYYLPGKCRIIITARVDNDLSARFQRLERVMINDNLCPSLMVSLASDGGAIYPAMTMGELIRSRNYSTEILKGYDCVSACALVFISGKHRMARSSDTSTRMGLHKPTVTNSDGRQCMEYNSDPNMMAFYRRYLYKMLDRQSAEIFFDLTNKASCTSVYYIDSQILLKTGIANTSVMD